jgi:hypothetical protein
MEWALPLPGPLLIRKILVVVDLNLNMPRPFQVKGVRLDMPCPFQAREKGIVTHPAYSLRNGAVQVPPWPTARLSEYIIFTFQVVRDIHDKDMKSDFNIRKQTASKLDPRDGNVWTSIVVETLHAGPQSFPVNVR